jgi:hypothetical protein
MNFYGSALDRRNEEEAVAERQKEFDEKRELSNALLELIETDAVENDVAEYWKDHYKKAIMIAMRYANV